jgi:hypothetical protein
MDRKKVYDLIDGERDYQDKRWENSGGRPKSDSETPVANWVLYIRYQVEEAMNAVYFLDEDKALEHIRKITALGVACMEYNETKPRK